MHKPILLLSLSLILACAAHAASGSQGSPVPGKAVRVQAAPQAPENGQAATADIPSHVLAHYLATADHDAMEARLEQANRLFLQLVRQYGYRQAVARWTGSPSEAR